MKKILIPTDFSACARASENLALAVAAKGNLELHFLHVMNAPQEWVHLPLEREKEYPSVTKRINEAKNNLSELMTEANKLNIEAKEFLHFNYGAEAIYKHIEAFDIDMVIMGAHGISGARNMIGSIASKVLRNVHVPILFLKEECWLEQVRKVVFASTFEEEVQDAFQFVLDLNEIIGAKVELLYVNTPAWFLETDETLEKMKDFKESAGVENYTEHIYNSLNEGRGIDKFIRRERADMVAMTTHGRKGLLRFISPSITEEIINNSDVPVLSINIR